MMNIYKFIFLFVLILILQSCATVSNQLLNKEPGIVKMAIDEYRVEFGVKNESVIDATIKEQGAKLCNGKYKVKDKEIEDIPKLYLKVIATLKCIK